MKDFIKGILFGSLVGGIGGLMMAPRSGKETQQLIKDEIEEWGDLKADFDDSLQQFKESMNNFQEVANATIQPFADSINQSVENFKFQAEPRLDQITKQVEKIQSELPEMPELEENSKEA